MWNGPSLKTGPGVQFTDILLRTLTVSTPLLKVRFVVTLRPFSKRVDIDVPVEGEEEHI